MRGAPNTGSFVAMVTLWCLLLFVGHTGSSALELPFPSELCSTTYQLADLENEKVDEYHNYTDGNSRTILTILSKLSNGLSKEDLAAKYGLQSQCLIYLDFTLPEVALFLLKTSQFKEVTFKGVFDGVFVNEVETALKSVFVLQAFLKTYNVVGNETLVELASVKGVSLDTTTILDLFLLYLDHANLDALAKALEVGLSTFDLLNRTAKEVGVILAVPNADDVKHYSFLRLIKIALIGRDYFHGLQTRIRQVRHSLGVSVREIKEDLYNSTTVLDLVLSKVPMDLHHLLPSLIGVETEHLLLLNITLQEFAGLLNKTAMQFYDYKLSPQLLTFIVKTRKHIFEINQQAKEEARKATLKILLSYNVTIGDLIVFASMKEFEIFNLSPLRVEALCARYTLIRYANNLNMTLADVAAKLNKTVAELSHNLTVQMFHQVIRKLLVIRTFEVMSQMLGVSQHFLVNSLEIHVPVSSLSMCQLDSFFNITRHTVLGLSEVVNNKTLGFVVQINGVHVTFVYKLTIERFIIHVLHLDLHYFFTLNGLKYNSSRLEILKRYHFFELEHLFQLRGDDPMFGFVIFRHSLVWIIKHIFYLVEHDVDECWHKKDKCHFNSRCRNLPGTYECICPPTGYRGRFCDDIDECEEGVAVCPENAVCRNVPGSYRCECGRGFRHNEANNTCDDIDECASIFDNNCYWSNADCTNTPGSYKCTCAKGFRFDNDERRCKDINECEEDRHVCHRIDNRTECKNKRGGFECSCERGFAPAYNTSVSPRVLFNCTDIDECATGQKICSLYSKCINIKGGAACRCLPGFVERNGQCRSKRFVIVLVIWVRVISVRAVPTRIDVASGFPYFGELYKKIYVYHNGLIAIGKHYYRSEPKKLTSLNKNVIAVFWANTDISSASKISYQVVDRSTPEFREQLDSASDLLKNCSGLTEFNATWMLIVTWERVSPYARFRSFPFFFFIFNPYTDEQSSYQAVLITNGTSSYVIYSYEDGGMNWNRRLQRKCAVGYATKNKKYSFEDEDSFRENIFNIDSKEFDVDGIRTRGTFCKSLNAPDKPVELTNEQKCLNWYNQEPDPNFWLSELSECPPVLRSCRLDGRYSYRGASGRRGSRVFCYELKFPTRVYRASHQCCYFERRGRRGGAFVSIPPQGGRAYRFHFRHPSRQKSDIEPFQVCCSAGETLCNLFYEKRPLTTAASAPSFPLPCTCRQLAGGCRFGRTCERQRPRRPWRGPRFVWSWGDPHVLTLDGLQYTFNGLGDYVLIRTIDRSVHLHAKTKRPLTSKGELSNATVFSGFAFKTNESDSGQVMFDDSVPGNLSITISGMDGSCNNYTIADFDEAKDFTGMSIQRSEINNKTVSVSFPSGFSIEVTPGIGLVQISVKALSDMMNQTRGLLGNFNDIKADDLMYPNETMLSSNATEEEIFHLGQQWRVPHDERIFVSSSCILLNVSFDNTFVPSFLNESAVTPEIRAICGTNRECLFDVLQTGNKEIGKETLGFEEDNQAAVAELGNTPPNITGPDEISVIVNQMTKFYLTVIDPDNDTVTLEVDELPEGANFTTSGNVGHFIWTPVNASNITLEFVATDSKNATSVHPVVINMCKCENNGTCDFTEFVGDNTGPFRLVGCNCSDEYEGTFCEIEVPDACADDPCADNVTCNTTRNPFGFKCGPCPPGLTGNGENCYEFDECANASLSQCNQTCVNTFGSFRCECKYGFNSREEGRICEDINECQNGANLNNCTDNAFCTNSPGSFNCTCNAGYEGDPIKNCTDIDECSNGVARCSQICRNTPGSFECSCRDGFQLAVNNETCEDINECEGKHKCQRICDNRIGSYICRCPPGFELSADNATCKVAEGSECDATNGCCSHTCVNRTGLITCYCNEGYNLTADGKTCEDINECMMESHGCSDKCLNIGGSFTCGCHPGYSLSGDMKTCTDVNECDTQSLNNCSQVCENSNGSFLCSCDDGFILQSDNRTCSDVDECAVGNPCSAGVCSNVPGSFQCACPPPTFYSDGKCQGVRVFAFGLTLTRLNDKSVEWQEELANPKSVEFGLLARRVEKQLNDYYRRRSRFARRFLRCIVRKFRRSSVIAEVDLNFAENATDVTTEALKNDLPTSGEMGNLTYNPSNAAISDFNECGDKATHNCHMHARCINKPGSFECKCKDDYNGDGVNNCEYSPKPADDTDDNKRKTLAIIFGTVFGVLVLLIIIGMCCWLRNKHYKADFEDSKNTSRLASRTVRSDVSFPENAKEDRQRTGSYELQAASMYANLDKPRGSGDYDYPDPQPAGTRETFPYYDNPGLQKEGKQEDLYRI